MLLEHLLLPVAEVDVHERSQLLLEALAEGHGQDLTHDAMGGVESNLVMKLRFPNDVYGSIQLSWDSVLANEFRIQSSSAEAVIRLGHFDKLAIKKSGKYEEVKPDISFPIDTLPGASKRIKPALYSQSMLCQLT